MKQTWIQKISLLILIFSLFRVGAQAEAAPSAQDLLARLDQAARAEAKVMRQSMTLISPGGQERKREMMTWSKQSDQGDQMLARFLAPADVKGTGILMSAEDMWLYLPALGRARRVAGHAKKGSFMGSDLSYADLEQISGGGFGESYEPLLLEGEELEGTDTFALKLVPLQEGGDYSFLKIWIESQLWLPRKIEYYDHQETLLKHLTTWELREIEGRWVALKMVIKDVQKGSETILEIKEVSFSEEIDDSVFTTRNLERGR
ncbi:MAG: outer membrane lipoprotein-sorting protein [Firmicutes bacterium]|nr:outer membrane lipoprotein-sorting protein [Bacillota bacterium]